jgi:predicted RNA-binding protein associated with RNAse of E/G family
MRSGEWQTLPHMTDYRSQLFGNMLVERATWGNTAATQWLGQTRIAAPGYVWVRFWPTDGEEPIEKYFDADRQLIGFYVPLCMPTQQRGDRLVAHRLLLGLWLSNTGQVTVFGEDEFEQAVARRELAPVEIEHAEFRIRTLTFEIHRKQFPRGLVRTFALAESGEQNQSS